MTSSEATTEELHNGSLQEFESLGYSVVRGLLTSDQCCVYKDAVLSAVEKDAEQCKELPGKQSFIALDLVHLDQVFIDILDDARLDKVFSQVLGDHWTLYSMTSTILPARERPYTTAIHTDTPRLIPNYHTGALLTISLDDFTEENGATYFLPGSQTRADKPDEDDFYAAAVQNIRSAGDAVLFDPRVWHAGGTNRSNETRCAFTLYGCRPWMKQRFDFPRMLGTEILPKISERQRRILGFDARTPTCMSEFYRPPADRLYKSGQG